LITTGNGNHHPKHQHQQLVPLWNWNWLDLSYSLFTLLLTLKHSYLIRGPLSFLYLWRKFCFFHISDEEQNKVQFDPKRLVLLGTTALPLPSSDSSNISSSLFHFQRGPCHDYWAGNIWALYLFAEKVCKFLIHKHPLLSKFIPSSYPVINPIQAATCLLSGVIPAMICAWKAASASHPKLRRQNQRQNPFLYCVIYSSMTSFTLSYHVHEKAIMSSVIPMNFLALTCEDYSLCKLARLFLRMATVGHLGLMP